MRLEGDFGSAAGAVFERRGGWTATLDASPERIPALIRECATDYKTCWTFTWRSDHFDGLSDSGLTAYVVVESFLPNSVVLWASHPSGLTAVMAGRMSSGGDHVVDGEWHDSNGSAGRFTMAWDDAVNDLPAANNELERMPPPGSCFQWFTGLVCPYP